MRLVLLGFLKVDQVTEDKVEKARRLNEVAVRRGHDFG